MFSMSDRKWQHVGWKLFLQTSARWQPSWPQRAAHSHLAVDVADSWLSRGSKQTVEMRLILHTQHTNTVSQTDRITNKTQIIIKTGVTYFLLVQWRVIVSLCFDTVKLLDGRQEKHPACTKLTGMVICMKWDANNFAYGPADVTATPPSLISLNPAWFLPFWCRLTQVVLKKRPLNGCSFVCWVES